MDIHALAGMLQQGLNFSQGTPPGEGAWWGMARAIEAADDEPAIGAGSRRLRGEELSLLKGHLFGQTKTKR